MIPVKDILITPEHFFSELCKKEISLRVPLLIILIIGFLSAISTFIVTEKTMAMMPSDMEGLGFVISSFSSFAALIISFIYWIVWAIAFLIMIYIMKGEASFKRIAEITAYGFIPQIFGGIISMAVMATSLSDLVIPATSNIEEIEAAMKALSTSPPMMAVMFISIIFVLWSANIWIFGVKESSKLEFKKAAICVGVPVLIYILLTSSSLFI